MGPVSRLQFLNEHYNLILFPERPRKTGQPQIQEVCMTKEQGEDDGDDDAVRPPRMLDLFSGSGSVGDEFRRQGFQVTSVDNDATCEPTHVVDVLSWDYKSMYIPGYFDVIFCVNPL